ncbi:MAG: MBL fold metallo-hydrolase [Actinobacteria bacterium]|nr:MBL fold metallo-hydrolase [Actinomycetota bacterium]
MRVTFLRNATALIATSGRLLLVDPMLRDAATSPPIDNTPNPRPNPLVDLPRPAPEIVRGIDGCIVTHLHGDHFDDAADELLPRDLPILTQPESVDALRERGFTRVTDVYEGWLGLDLVLTRGQHGTGAIGEAMGAASGFVLDGVYFAGDTIWCDDAGEAIASHRPRAVVVNGGGARFNEGDPIVMTVADVREVRAATDGVVVVDHLEAMNHCLELRPAFRGIEGVLVPDDGETLEL